MVLNKMKTLQTKANTREAPESFPPPAAFLYHFLCKLWQCWGLIMAVHDKRWESGENDAEDNAGME